MKKYNIRTKILTKIAYIGLIVLVFTSCSSYLNPGQYRDSTTQMIDEYMATKGSNLDLYLSIISKAGLQGMMHAYGTYTCFAPTDSAVNTYLKENNLSISTMTQAQAAQIVKFHTISDTIPTSSFIDGRLPYANMLNVYLTTQTQNDNSILVNRQGILGTVNRNIQCGNGYIHKIDKVLTQQDSTVYQKFTNLGNDYSVMKFLASKLDAVQMDSLIDGGGGFRTLLLQNDSAFINAGFNISDKDAFYTAFQAELKNNATTTTDPSGMLYNWFAYHILPSRSYITDMTAVTTLSTKLLNQPLTLVYRNDSLLVNEFKEGELNDQGILVNRKSTYTDYTCSNGVIQTLESNLEVKAHKPYRVYWDICAQPEIEANSSYKKEGTSINYTVSSFSNITFGGSSSNTLTYIANGTSAADYQQKWQVINGDYMSLRLSTSYIKSMAMKLPLLVAGTYKVWVCYRQSGSSTKPIYVKTTFQEDNYDDQVLPIIANFSDEPNSKYTDDQLLALGWKYYTAKNQYITMCSKLLGTITVYATGQHTLLFTATNAAATNAFLDEIQFIPVDEDQIWPRQDIRGTLVPEGTAASNIFPY